MAIVRSQQRKEKRNWDRVAWALAAFLNVHRKKNTPPVKPEELLGRPLEGQDFGPKLQGKKQVQAERRAILARLSEAERKSANARRAEGKN